MKQKLNFILCATGHLPSGSSDEEFEALYDTEIKPLISALNKYPKINIVFHYSGVILNWIESKHPEFFMLLEDLLSRKQAEFLGGGFYEPAFTLLPLSDKIGQIEMFTTYLRKNLGKKPLGCWLPAMAWEQNMVEPLNSCGMNYTFLEDRQFSLAGLKPDAGGIYSPCITEYHGKLIMVFPVSDLMYGEMPEGKIQELIGKLLESLPQDGETRTMVFSVGQTEYESLFAALSNADSGVKFTCPAKIFKNLRSLKKAYFPGVWALGCHPENETNPQQFLADHPEAAGIYAKMTHVHTLINNQLRGDKTRKRTALEELWKAQDSGVFRPGNQSSHGLSHSPLRKAAYRSILEAEKIIREKNKFTPALSVFDFDLDGEGEYIFQDEKLNCYIKSMGSGLFELDYIPCTWNYLDTMVSAVKGEKRCAFVDWLATAGTLPEDVGPEGIRDGRFCGKEEYEVHEVDRVHRRVTFRLPPKADLFLGEIEAVKTWQLKKNSIMLEYVLRNSGTNSQSFVFSTSLDLSFPGEEHLRIFRLSDGENENITFNDAFTIRNARGLEFQDRKNETIITFELNRNFDARIFHFRSGFSGREEYQSTCVMPLLPVSLESGKSWKMSCSLKINS